MSPIAAFENARVAESIGPQGLHLLGLTDPDQNISVQD